MDIVIPVGNEQDHLAGCVRELRERLADSGPGTVRISIAEAGSTDETLAIAERLAREFPEVRVFHFAQAGLGRALRKVWESSPAPVLARCDTRGGIDPADTVRALEAIMAGSFEVSSASAREPIGRAVARAPGAPRLRFLHRHPVQRVQAGGDFTALRATALPGLLSRIHNDDWLLDERLLQTARRARLHISTNS